MCRSKNHPGGPRRCSQKTLSPKQIAESNDARNARRRARYAEKKDEALKAKLQEAGNGSHAHFEPDGFAKAMTRDENGQLIKMYHCSNADFENFDPKFRGRVGDDDGKPRDQYGSGFYFNPNLETISHYGKNVHEVYLNITNPYVVTSGNMNDITVDKDAVINILKSHPDAYRDPDDDDNYSILSDYSPEFWERTQWSKEEKDRMIEEMAEEYYSGHGNFNDLESLFDEHLDIFRRKMHEHTGHDGVVADMGEYGKHYIAWVPEQIHHTGRGKSVDNKFVANENS